MKIFTSIFDAQNHRPQIETIVYQGQYCVIESNQDYDDNQLPSWVKDITYRRNSINLEDIRSKYDSVLTDYIDSVARSKGYEDRISCAVRAAFPGPWQQEGIAFGQWMDQCNEIGYQIVAGVQTGQIELPSLEEFIAMLPPMQWPE